MATAVKVEHINPFLKASIETFRSMVRCEIKPGKIRLKSAAKAYFDISGIIGLSGGAKGSVILSFNRLTALKVVSAFGGIKVVTLDDMVVDAIGELTNIVAGSAKKDLMQYKISISLPSVVLGTDHTLNAHSDIVPLMVPFESPFGNFALIVCFASDIA